MARLKYSCSPSYLPLDASKAFVTRLTEGWLLPGSNFKCDEGMLEFDSISDRIYSDSYSFKFEWNEGGDDDRYVAHSMDITFNRCQN